MTLRDLIENEQKDERALLTDGTGDPNTEEDDSSEDTSEFGGMDDVDEEDHRNMPTERRIDRLIRVKIPKIPLGDKARNLWLFTPGFMEQIVLGNYDLKGQQSLWRRWQDIEDQNQGDGNDELVQSRQRSLGMKIISQRARSDMPEAGTRERMALVTFEKRERMHQTVTTDRSGGVKAVSFLSRLLGK